MGSPGTFRTEIQGLHFFFRLDTRSSKIWHYFFH